jgi:hypothetical protein
VVVKVERGNSRSNANNKENCTIVKYTFIKMVERLLSFYVDIYILPESSTKNIEHLDIHAICPYLRIMQMGKMNIKVIIIDMNMGRVSQFIFPLSFTLSTRVDMTDAVKFPIVIR